MHTRGSKRNAKASDATAAQAQLVKESEAAATVPTKEIVISNDHPPDVVDPTHSIEPLKEPSVKAEHSPSEMEMDLAEASNKRKRTPDPAKDDVTAPEPSPAITPPSALSAIGNASDMESGENPNKKIKLESTNTVIKQLKPDSKLDGDEKVDSPLPRRPVDGQLSLDRSELPVQIWDHIFSFLAPRALASASATCKRFNTLLTGQSEDREALYTQTFQSILPSYTSDKIWGDSRRRFVPDMPKPLIHATELQMFQMIFGNNCQSCGKPPSKGLISNEDAWSRGPGEDGVRNVWPFVYRMCGQCLIKRTERDFTLLMSSAIPSYLLAALPFIFVTTQKNVVLPHVLEESNPPAGVPMPEKRFFKPQIDKIRNEFDDVKALGGAAAEEWQKGLEATGSERQKDALRLEKWEFKGDMTKLRQSASLDGAFDLHAVAHGTSSVPFFSQGPTAANGYGQIAGPNLPKRIPSINMPPNGLPGSVLGSRPPFLPQVPVPFPTAVVPPQPKVERSLEEVNQAKAIRKQEIERRCAQFDPPIPPNILAQMESFQAAIQISTVLTDSAWEVLKPRLMSQRDLAEKRESERVASELAAQQRLEERKQQESQAKEARDNLERDWDEKQNPIRDILGEYAEERIAQRWNETNAITKENCPNFAADVLLYVRKKFYNRISKEDAEATAAGREPEKDPATGPPTRRLILENMKWVYDSKIKCHTESFRKELFICHDCKESSKFYGFEGVIQHFAAKHTNALSVGPVVVHWRAEWPEHSPFHPDPAAARSMSYSGGHMQAHRGPGYGGYNGYNAHSAGPVPHPYSSGGFPYPQPVSDAYSQRGPYQGLHHPESFQPQRGGPYGQPYTQAHGYQDLAHGYPPRPPTASQPYETHQQGPYHGNNQYSYSGPTPEAYGNGYSQSYPGPGHDRRGFPHNGYPQGPYGQAGQPGHSRPPYPSAMGQNTNNPYGRGDALQTVSPMYKKHLEDMAISAREIWSGTSNITGLPLSVKLFVLIHHVRTRFQNRYNYPLSLGMFVDAMENHHIMKAIKGIPGVLCCRTCQSENVRSQFQRQGPYSRTNQSYDLSNGYSPTPDWAQDMVDLPEESTVKALINAPGMDDHKLSLLAAAFPQSFPNPLPKLDQGSASSFSGHRNSDYGVAANASYRTAEPQPLDPLAGYAQPRSGSSQGEPRGSSNPMVSYGYGQPTETGAPKTKIMEDYGYKDSHKGSPEYDPSESHIGATSAISSGGAMLPTSLYEARQYSSEPTLTLGNGGPKTAGDREEREPSYDPRESALVFPPSKNLSENSTQPRSRRHNRDSAHGVEEGSEDGEVGPASIGSKASRNREAEQFLSKMGSANRPDGTTSRVSDAHQDQYNTGKGWPMDSDVSKRSRVAVETYEARPDEITRTADSSLRQTPTARGSPWTADSPGGTVSTREYGPDARAPRSGNGNLQDRRYVEYAEAQHSRGQADYYGSERSPQKRSSDREVVRQYEMENYDPYVEAQPNVDQYGNEVYRRSAHQQQRASREQAYRVGSSHSHKAEVPEDLKNYLRVPGSTEERGYIDDPRRQQTYRIEYVAQAPEDRRASRYVYSDRAVSAGYPRYQDPQGRPIYVEQQPPAYSNGSRVYDRNHGTYREVRYG